MSVMITFIWCHVINVWLEIYLEIYNFNFCSILFKRSQFRFVNVCLSYFHFLSFTHMKAAWACFRCVTNGDNHPCYIKIYFILRVSYFYTGERDVVLTHFNQYSKYLILIILSKGQFVIIFNFSPSQKSSLNPYTTFKGLLL